MKKSNKSLNVTELSAYDLEVVNGGASTLQLTRVSLSSALINQIRRFGAGGGSKGGFLNPRDMLINPALTARF